MDKQALEKFLWAQARYREDQKKFLAKYQRLYPGAMPFFYTMSFSELLFDLLEEDEDTFINNPTWIDPFIMDMQIWCKLRPLWGQVTLSEFRKLYLDELAKHKHDDWNKLN